VAANELLPERMPREGELVQVRSRRWLVEAVRLLDDGKAVVDLACADDDAQGEELQVLWEYEIDRRILQEEGWADLASRGFDDPRQFAAFLNTLRWNTVTATEPNLFQAPFRAGITIDAYQMEPLRKALRLPRVNLFIADDTGLGKTIEAGLIARELLLRKKVKTIVVAAPPSVLEQWKAELDERFGLVFEVLDRRYFAEVRRERGFGINPWETHSRFLVSHNLLTDPTYADPMRAWLGQMKPGSLLILDEAHHAAPSSGGRYGIETKFTRAIRDLGSRFEHRLFLSATPHNGHSNSFSTLLELLDPTRFTRGVRVRGKRALEDIMVRRLKEDIRAIQGGFPRREVVRVEVSDLPSDAPELVLSNLLDDYRSAREERFADESSQTRASAGLLIVGLQQRLLSSIEAFARSLETHRRTVERQWAQAEASVRQELTEAQAEQLLLHPPGSDDEEADRTDADIEELDRAAFEAVTDLVEAAAERTATTSAQREREQRLLDQMQEVATTWRHQPDGKDRALIDWIREHICPDLPEYGQAPKGPAPQWNDRRVLIFTESREGTKRHLVEILGQAIAHTEAADERIAVITGMTSGEARKQIQRSFNTDPSEDPVRILIATDAAREGLNFQAHCADLFHFDLPWNPGRIEQRNGRIDRKLQPADTVRCHYFVLSQRPEDRVLEVLVKKTETIKRELGSLSKVIDDDIERRLSRGIRHADADEIATAIAAADVDAARKHVADEELEQARERQDELQAQIDRCRTLLENSRRWVGFEPEPFRNALDCALELLDGDPLVQGEDEHGRPVWTFPPIDRRVATDPSWSATMDTLRSPRKTGDKLADWRRDAPVRPVVFEDAGVLTDETVHLHLEQRVAQRLLSRFRAQGFIYDDLSRAALVQVRDSIPRVVLLGRLSLYGTRAERLHEELVPVAARWTDADQRGEALSAYAKDATASTMRLLDEALGDRAPRELDDAISRKLLAGAGRDVEELLPQLNARATELAQDAIAKLTARGEREANDLHETLVRQRDRVRQEQERHQAEYDQLTFGYDADERRQLEQNMKAWERRLVEFDEQLQSEPQRLSDFYVVQATRVEPVGLVYLWPDTN
jgi:superfamily II DNA or RNA helicase